MIIPSEKLSGIKPYYFLNLQHKIDALQASGKRIIRLDIGSPDLPPPPQVLDCLIDTIKQSDSHGYTSTIGPLYYREAVANYYQKRFNVSLNPENEISPLLGSKEAIINLHQVLVNPGDTVLIPNPGYPSYAFGAKYAGANVLQYDLTAELDFSLDLQKIRDAAVNTIKLVWLNFPNNPTGSIVQSEVLEELVHLAIKHQFILIHDAPYTDIYYDHHKPPSILSIPGAKKVAVEINSLSKTYHMAGWRIGMICGNRDVISALQTLKSKVDNSTAIPIFRAASQALRMDDTWITERNQIIKKRRDLWVEYLNKISPRFTPAIAGFYLWAQIPPSFNSDIEFCDAALNETGVSMTPGSIYGSNGINYFRISLCQPEEVLLQAIQNLQAWNL
jgi:aspartate/methionine/tyrosine aminotransferase